VRVAGRPVPILLQPAPAVALDDADFHW
jgi:hypothetical protein